MQLGFVIDHGKCIGCHACTVACKAENGVPLGKFRTWVKYTERGTFPRVRRSFAVLRCNQCSAPPCVEICPVRALSKREDGIVDVDPAACIGCKACMQACPYDALYIDPENGIAEKCHFCAHRTERGLAPACAVVCPTEAIVPGDFDDLRSRVSQLVARNPASCRKPEAGTRPNVHYLETEPAGIDPLATSAAGGYLWAERMPGTDLTAEAIEATLDASEHRARTTYDVDHPSLWGAKVSTYLWTKSLAAGLGFASVARAWLGGDAPGVAAQATAWAGWALAFLALTGVLLIADLKRPARFLFILLRPNPRSWLVRGSWILTAYAGLLVAWIAALSFPSVPPGVRGSIGAAALVAGALTACYTGWLFGQARGRVLWMRRGLWLHLVVQALVAGWAVAVARGAIGTRVAVDPLWRWGLVGMLATHALFVATETLGAPAGRGEEYARASALLHRGPLGRRRLAFGVVAGIALPVLLLSVTADPRIAALAAAFAGIGLWVEDDALVRAGQALPIS